MNKQIKPFETWVIRNKNTGEYFVAPSGKNSWKAKAHAKNAWASVSSNWHEPDKEVLSQYGVLAVEDTKRSYKRYRFPYFDEQDTWELVNLAKPVEEVGSDLKRAIELLRKVVDEGYINNHNVEKEILQFLGEDW